MAQRNQQSIGSQASDGSAERSVQRVALLKSLEYLYFEACSANISLVATLIGAAVEALKDDLAALNGTAQHSTSSRGITINDHGTPQILIDDDDLDDDDYIVEFEDEDDEEEENEDDDEEEGEERRG